MSTLGVGIPYARAVQQDGKWGNECPVCGAFYPMVKVKDIDSFITGYAAHYAAEHEETAMETATETRTLPISGLPVGPQPFAIKKIRTWRSHDGQGCEATYDGSVVGTIVDEGTGGGAWFRPTAPEIRAEWKAFVAATPAYDMDPNREYGTDALMVSGEEAVAELLVTEALVAKKLAAVVKKGQRIAFVTPEMDRRVEFGTVGRSVGVVLPEGALAWNGSEYVKVWTSEERAAAVASLDALGDFR